MNIREALPVHPQNRDEARAGDEAGGLRIDGLVERPQLLTAAKLGALPRTTLAERFACEEGWSVDGLAWEGIPLLDVLALGRPLPQARCVRVSAGGYWLALSLADCARALLCDRLNGQPLPREHGAPWRLVVSGGECFTSVKWVSALELAAEPGDATAERIARARIATVRDE
jgi:DMSO/TMAO reductase YedYZ molybdopterin-dependent catalytic subunit